VLALAGGGPFWSDDGPFGLELPFRPDEEPPMCGQLPLCPEPSPRGGRALSPGFGVVVPGVVLPGAVVVLSGVVAVVELWAAASAVPPPASNAAPAAIATADLGSCTVVPPSWGTSSGPPLPKRSVTGD
jgi:hypothetical protein